MAGLMAGPVVIIALLLFAALFPWFFCRIEPSEGRIAVLIHKTGQDLPSGQILALKPDEKGIQLDVLAEGRHWRNPYAWGWEYKEMIDIPAGKLGVVTRLYGADLPPNRISAGPDTKGILADVLSPGKYRLNPYAFKVDLYDAMTIRPGFCGVVTALVGEDVFSSGTNRAAGFLVGKDMKGVLPEVLEPGTYYLNPFVYNVVELNLQSQRFEMSGPEAINFLTMDGFTVVVEGTIEFAVQREQAALLTHRVGDMDDIVRKVIMPRTRGFSRIEGSKHPATTFIVGETRQQFQKDLEAHLRGACESWGVEIRSVLIRNIIPPDEIASIIRDREVAVQESQKYEQEIAQAKSKAELVKQETLAIQNKEKVDADTVRIRAKIGAEQEQAVRVVSANKDLAVVKLERDAAAAQAQAITLKAQAEADVIRMSNTAEAAVIANQILAFSNGLNYARNTFYKKIGPRIQSILSTDQGDGLGALFLPYLPERAKEVKP
jgi:regulator of protease activity HflC (stomatin/prohibitin superfamily)